MKNTNAYINCIGAITSLKKNVTLLVHHKKRRNKNYTIPQQQTS